MQYCLNDRLTLSILCCALIMSGCGGGGTSQNNSSAPATGNGCSMLSGGAPMQGCLSTSTSTVVTPPAPIPDQVQSNTVSISTAEFAQTHVMPESGLSWKIYTAAALGASGVAATPSASEHLSLIGSRETLALISFVSPVTAPMLEAWNGSTRLGSVALNVPGTLPPTEDKGPAYSTTAWNAVMPATWMIPGVSIKVSDAGQTASTARTLDVGADSGLDLKILPFYLFGANDANTGTASSVIAAPPLAVQNEVFAKWPVAKLNAANHPIGRIDLPDLVLRPGMSTANNPAGVPVAAQPAYVITSMNQQRDSYGVMGAVLSMIGQIRAANGESSTNNQYYSPIIGLDTTKTSANKLYFLGGGLGSVGGGTGVGDESYGGVFIHEQGHAFGLGHVGTEYANGTYPYAAGSLAGSAWGYDPFHKEFLSPYVPTSATSYMGCASWAVMQSGRCVKQDPMQGGAGTQSSAYKYATFSDYTTARMQRWMDGRIMADANFSTGYSRWDSASKKRVAVDPAVDPNKGLYGVNAGLPIIKNVPVYAIAITLSNAGGAANHSSNVAAGISRIYPPIAYVGNLLRNFDPSVPSDLSSITVDTGTYPWYCKGSGCDYTLRVTYSDATVIYRVLKDGFRPWFGPTSAPATTTTDPLNSNSFHTWVINVPGTNATGTPVTITKTELLNTPMVWTIGATPPNATTALTVLQAATVLLTR